MEKCVVFLCQEHELKRELRGYFDAFSKRITTVCPPLKFENGAEDLSNILPVESEPILILQPNVFRLPEGMANSKYPTACFQIDTYSGTERRIKWSMLYDYAFVFHPKYDRLFEESGHPRAICLAHAVEASLFEPRGSNDIYDIGWVGNLQGSLYRTRRQIITGLRGRFQMNDTTRKYTANEMADIYKKSRIAINVGREDFLPDANLRCFEVMAGGALLMTMRPTELSDLGFIEGIHYESFETESELHDKVRYFLANETERCAKAEAARDQVMKHHTYDARAEEILNIVCKDEGKHFAPCRHWNQIEVHATYLHFFAKNLMIDAAVTQLNAIRRVSSKKALTMFPLVVKAFVRSLQLALQNKLAMS